MSERSMPYVPGRRRSLTRPSCAPPRRRIRRRGAVLAAALVCMLLLLLFAGALARTMAVQHRAARWEVYRQQSLWLAESACVRAVARCRADPDYAGETWQVSIAPLGEASAAQDALHGDAIIRVTPVDSAPAGRQIEVTAHWPRDALDRVSQRREFLLPPAN